MGVTLGKSGANDSQATSKWRRAVATVNILNKTEKESHEKRTKAEQETINSSNRDKDDNTGMTNGYNSSRIFLQTDDDDKEDTKSCHNFVYRDTSDAWAALRAGNVPEATATDTEFTVVDSALGGYRALERTRVSDETEDTLGCGDDGDGKTGDGEEDDVHVPYEPPGGWDADETEVK